jgi:cytochrome P450
MARDARHYRNPEMFDPTRFMGDKPELDPHNYIFEFGRRICPGKSQVVAVTVQKKAQG